MDVEDWHTATAVQATWRDGQQEVMDQERKKKENAAKQAASEAKVRAKAGR